MSSRQVARRLAGPHIDVMWIARLSALAASVLLAMPAVAQDGHSFTALAYATRVAGLSVMLTEVPVISKPAPFCAALTVLPVPSAVALAEC